MFRKLSSLQAYLLIAIALGAAGLHSVPSFQVVVQLTIGVMTPVELSTRPEHAFFHQHPLNPSVRRIGCMSLKWEDVRLGHPLGIPQVETTQTMPLKLKVVVKRLRRDHEPIFFDSSYHTEIYNI